MKKALMLLMLVFVGSAGWRIGSTLSSDAISMAVGIFFGVLAGIPAALLVMASERHRVDRARPSRGMNPQTHYEQGGAPQPPVIILTGNGQAFPAQRQSHGAINQLSQGGIELADWPQGERPARRFKVVGEQEAWLE